MRRLAIAMALVASAGGVGAGEVNDLVDENTGWAIYSLNQGSVAVAVAPAAGANAYSIRFKNTELLRQPNPMKDLRGFRYGTPILYPTPNRVKDGRFTFEGQTYEIPPNDGPNALHGLACTAPFEVKGIQEQEDRAAIRCELKFAPGTPWFEKFPFEHTLVVEIAATDSAVRWTYTVDNTAGKKKVPYGFGLHPWFLYQGSRANTYLTVPATHRMESKVMLPTGRLIALEGSDYDLRKPHSLGSFVADDVYFGVRPQTPAVIDFRDPGLLIGLWATADFTHMVVYTPMEDWFCVENQTCSTDAHNLYARGLARESNLLMVEVGGTQSGWVEYRFKDY